MNTRTLEKISAVLLVAVLGVALTVEVDAVGPALLLVAALVVTVTAGMELVLRGEARYRPTFDLFILPASLVVAATLCLRLLPTGVSIVTGLALFGALLFTVFWAECGRRIGIVDRRTGETALTLVGYITAFLLYAAVYHFKSRSLFSAPAIVVITFLLAARQLRQVHQELHLDLGTPDQAQSQVLALGQRSVAEAGTRAASAPAQRMLAVGWPRTMLYAAVVALAAGEITWALNYWPLNGLFGGAFLLTTFYFLVGIFSHDAQHRLSGRLVAEYGAVAVTGALLLTLAGLLRRAS